MPEKIIKYRWFDRFGKQFMVAVDAEQVMAIKLLTGNNTITPNAKEGLEKLGFQLKEVLREEK